MEEEGLQRAQDSAVPREPHGSGPETALSLQPVLKLAVALNPPNSHGSNKIRLGLWNIDEVQESVLNVGLCGRHAGGT